MFNSTAKMSLEASDVQSDCEDLIEEDFSLPADIISERTPRRKQSTGKPPSSQRSPYLCSLDLSSKRSSMGTWRRPRVSLGETRGDTSGESVSACLTSLSNGHDGPHTLASEAEQKPSIRKHRSLHFESNGFTAGVGEHMKKEDMYDEIIRLKKSLHSQKSDNQQMKVKLRRLEEENAKRERQIEELLDPTKGSEHTHSLVDKKREGSVVVNGLKQRILKLEQQCREKGNALSKLQSELRTTSLEELKITVETYFEEIQRLRMLLEAAEKSSRAESKCSQRQQKVLSSTVQRLAENLKQLQQENAALREELNTDSPAGGIKGYREWSKQRLLRRLLELEKRLGSSRRHAQSAKSSTRLDKEVQATLTAAPRFTMATEMAVSVGTVTEEAEEISGQSNHLSQLEKDKVDLQELLSCKDEELSQLRAERDELQRQTQRLKAEHKKQMDHKKQQHRQELEHLRTRSQTLEEERNKLVTAELSSPPPPPVVAENHGDTQEEVEQMDTGCKEKEVDGNEEHRTDAETRKREKAALVIQTRWRQHRQSDIVMLQSALRGHVFRESQLKVLMRDPQDKALESLKFTNSIDGAVDEVALTMIQSAFRGHLARCPAIKRSGIASPAENSLPLVPERPVLTHSHSAGSASQSFDTAKDHTQEVLWPTYSTTNSRISHTQTHGTTQRERRSTSEFDAAVQSDDSDDIIVSPSRPMRSREVLMS
uniref:IQ motif containing E n=1 Tax=Nothobranchius pienaari TaxID=704102 RepID=A0A1A8MPN9_9TELE